MIEEDFAITYEDLIRLSAELERMKDAGGVVRMACSYHNKHGGGPLKNDEPQVFDASQLAWQLEQALRTVRDGIGFRAVVRDIFRGDGE